VSDEHVVIVTHSFCWVNWIWESEHTTVLFTLWTSLSELCHGITVIPASVICFLQNSGLDSVLSEVIIQVSVFIVQNS